ncbi:MAG TPA: site-specific integrase, partial [Actinomycetes bacterium]|nr:site-specific integrase [Actinomycetes bacterium]
VTTPARPARPRPRPRRLARRKVTRRGDPVHPAGPVGGPCSPTIGTALRERVLWRMLYETAARAQEILCMDVPDLDPAFRRARVTSKGGAIEYVSWVTATARLLPRLLAGRATGPVFLADRRAPTRGHCAPAADDIDPTTGRGRLSYPRAEYLFKQATTAP